MLGSETGDGLNVRLYGEHRNSVCEMKPLLLKNCWKWKFHLCKNAEISFSVIPVTTFIYWEPG
jgi:hypothetical protein